MTGKRPFTSLFIVSTSNYRQVDANEQRLVSGRYCSQLHVTIGRITSSMYPQLV